MGNAPIHVPWRCPICDHDEFGPVTLSNGKPTEALQWKGCTVMFRDIDLFNKNRSPMQKSFERPIMPAQEYVWSGPARPKRR